MGDAASVVTARLLVDPAQLDTPAAQETIARVAGIWRGGGLAAFPTETVYGLGANALDATAVAKIFTAKQRPGWDPLIVHVTDERMLCRAARDVPARARRLAEAFWPGPLTLLLPRADGLPLAVTSGRPLVGVRMPAHPVAQRLIAAAGIPIAAPSANAFGRTSPTTAAHVLQDLDGRIDVVVDAGPTAHGLESTVVDASGEVARVYRLGAVTLEEIRRVAGDVAVFRETPGVPRAEPEALPSPGVGLRHYAPRAELVLIEEDEGSEDGAQRAAFAQRAAELSLRGGLIGVMLPEEYQGLAPEGAEVFRWGRWSDPGELGRRVFLGLRELDSRGVTHIVCPLPPDHGIGAAVCDRLRKAARLR